MGEKVSIIVPVYKVEDYIQQCVNSIITQTMQNLEIILIDDGSPDRSGELLDQYAQVDQRIRVVHKENAGVSAARNDGLDICSGDYVYIMDSDDYLEPDAIEIMYKNAFETGADVVITDHYLFKEGDEGSQRKAHLFAKEFVTEDKELIYKIRDMVLYSYFSPFPTTEDIGLGVAAPWTKLLKRELITENDLTFDPYVKGIFDDGLFALNVFQNAKKVSYIRYNVYHYRKLGTSLMRGYNANRIEINERVFLRIREFGKKYKLNDNFVKAYNARVLLYLNYVFSAYLFHPNYGKNSKTQWEEYCQVLKMSSYQDAAKSIKNIKYLRKSEQHRFLQLKSRIYKYMYFLKRIM